MSARSVLGAWLTGHLPAAEYRVIPAADVPDNISKQTVIVLYQDNVARFEQVGHDRLRVSLTLWILTGLEDPLRAEDALESGLDDIIDALRQQEWVTWEQAERLTFGDPAMYHGYKLTLTALGQIGD